MNAKAFFDTNVLIYLYSIDEPEKQHKALQRIEATENRWVSTQVLSELSNTLHRKFKLEYSAIVKVISEIHASFQVITVQPDTIKQTLNLAQIYRYSYYDSLIIASALEQSSNILFSEDMQHEQIIEHHMLILNPFKAIELGNERIGQQQ
jgi:predicted nucleic acid-binding protein